MDINKYLKDEHAKLEGIKAEYPHAKRIECADGVSLSVQAGHHAYCSPRENYVFWHEVEVGFPSVEIKELMRYAEEPERPTETVYGYVPVALVEHIIESHGGKK
jgi:hypothetical protein